MKKKKIKPPTAAAMKKFAARFEPEEWKFCCMSPTFLEAVSEDLSFAEFVAVRILSDAWEESMREVPIEEAGF